MFIVYSKPQCPACDQAKQLLKSQNIQFATYELDVGQQRADGINYVSRDEVLSVFPGARTMPQIGVVRNSSFEKIGDLVALRAALAVGVTKI